MEINLSPNYKINIIRGPEYNKEEVIKEIKYNVEISRTTFEQVTEKSPGIQSDILIQTSNFSNIKNFIWKEFCHLYEIDSNSPYHLKYWTYISDNKNVYSGYHNHKMNDEIYLHNNYTWVLYIQIPDNLKGDDGKICFKTENDIEHKILPNEGDLIIFPADLPHRPETNTSSETERIVLAGNFCILDVNSGYKKKIKTFI